MSVITCLFITAFDLSGALRDRAILHPKKMRQRRKRLPTEPGSSTEEEWAEELQSLQRPHRRSSSHQQTKSFAIIILRYPILALVFGLIVINLLFYFTARCLVSVFEFLFSWISRKAWLATKLLKATSYQEWRDIAQDLDERLGLESWKTESSDETGYDESLVARITKRMRKEQSKGNLDKLTETLLSSACKQDLGGCENELLYSRTFTGTKITVEAYLDQVLESLEYIYDSAHLTSEEKASFFKHVSVMHGRTSLCLSGGATLGFFHLGVMKALWKERLLPSIITGTSAGAMMAAMVCCRTGDELEEIFDPSLHEKIHALSTPWSQMIKNFIFTGALIDDEFFRDQADWFTKGDMTFLEAFELSGRILNVTVMSNEGHSKTKILNYINSPNITVKSAVVASSAIPGLLPPCPLFAKDAQGKVSRYSGNGALWRDGSLRSDIPEKELQQLFRVKFTIVSQVNAHISMFFFRPRGHPGSPIIGRRWRGGFVLASLIKYFLLEVNKWLQFIRDMELLPRLGGANFSNLWTQSFEGNITLLPKFRLMNFVKIMIDPDYNRLDLFLKDGERCTWPTLPAIRNRMRLEQAIGKFLLSSRRDISSSLDELVQR